jgi:PA14 domain
VEIKRLLRIFLVLSLALFPLLVGIDKAHAAEGLTAQVYSVQGQNESPYIPQGASPVLTTNVPNIDFQWGSGSVLGGPSEDVIVRFTGSIRSDSTKNISFMATGDDGTRLYIDGALITDDWVDKGGGGSTSAPVSFTAGVPKTIELMYYENGGGANVFLYWDQSGSMDIIPSSAFTSQAAPVVKTIGPPRNLTVSDNGSAVVLNWEAPNTGNTQPERYAISFSADGGGWGIATGNVGDESALKTFMNIPYNVFESLKPSGTVWSFNIRSDNDTLALYSENSNVVTLKIGKTAEEIAAEQAAEQAAIDAENARLAAIAAEEARLAEIARLAEVARLAEIARLEAEAAALLAAQQEAARLAAIAEAERLAELERQRLAAEAEAARIEAERLAALEAARIAAELEAQRLAAIAEAARIESERLAALAEQQRIAAEQEAARLAAIAESERLAELERQRLAAVAESERLAELERQRLAALEAARIEAERIAAELKAKQEAEAKAAEEARLKAEAEAKAAEEARLKAEAERIAAEEAAKKAEEERIAAEKAEADRLEAEAKAKAEEEAKVKAELEAKIKAEAEAKKLAEEKAEQEARLKAESEAKLKAEQEAKAEADKAKAEQERLDKLAEEAKAGKELSKEEVAAVVTELIADLKPGQSISSAQVQESGVSYADLPPETPIEVRTSESGEVLVITAEVAANVELVQDPGALLEAVFTDPGAALAAFGSIGADMTEGEREEATDMVIATVVAAGAAINAAAVATSGSTGGSTGGGNSGGGGPSGANSPGSRGGRKW